MIGRLLAMPQEKPLLGSRAKPVNLERLLRDTKSPKTPQLAPLSAH